jgi:hypothetical protein
VEALKAFVHTTSGQRSVDLMDSAQSLEAGPAVEYTDQILDACRIQITDKGATQRRWEIC